MKKIVHMCMTVFTDEMAYQENLLAKYHRKLGYAVTVITSEWKYDVNGTIVQTDENDYINSDNIHIKRLSMKGKNDIKNKFRSFAGVYQALKEEKPDILFIHGFQYRDISAITKYIRQYHPERVYVDNHADYSNSATNWLSENIQHKVIWKYYAHMIEPFTRKFYGVLPARVDFLTELYQLPPKKCGLLLMGADDDMAKEQSQPETRLGTREKYGIGEADFLIVTGGKIDAWKKQTILLEEAVKKIQKEKVRLIIFGSIAEELKEKVMALCDDRIRYAGWLSVRDTYALIASADLAVYPGRHSTLWEQTAGQGIPMVVKYWAGTQHIDAGGNAAFLYQDSADEIGDQLNEMIDRGKKYTDMKTAAKKCAGRFLYGSIAKESLG